MIFSQPKFLGFETIEQLASQDSIRERIAYAMVVTSDESHHGSALGHRTKALVVQVELSSAIGYVLIRIGELSILAGEPHDNATALRLINRSRTLMHSVRSWLEARGFRVVQATFAHPRNYVFLEGFADFLEFDRGSDTYRLKPGTQEPTL